MAPRNSRVSDNPVPVVYENLVVGTAVYLAGTPLSLRA